MQTRTYQIQVPGAVLYCSFEHWQRRKNKTDDSLKSFFFIIKDIIHESFTRSLTTGLMYASSIIQNQLSATTRLQHPHEILGFALSFLGGRWTLFIHWSCVLY